jgi:hypothetical protein
VVFDDGNPAFPANQRIFERPVSGARISNIRNFSSRVAQDQLRVHGDRFESASPLDVKTRQLGSQGIFLPDVRVIG